LSESKQKQLSGKTLALILKLQQNEITESETYRGIASRIKHKENREVLLQLSGDETAHYEVWKKYTGREMKPQRLKVWRRKAMARILGFTFTIKLMESGEEHAQDVYATLADEIPESAEIEEQEEAHENALMDMLDEERLQYVGSMVLGLNDALVELTGTLAGLTLALQNTRIIALSGLITGISATLSMASSEFLSSKSEGREDALKSCAYTGVAYLITVALLILPYLVFQPKQYLFALGFMIVIVVLIILVFNYYISVAKGMKFKKRFLEMACISIGVAALSFVIGILVKNLLGVDI
jgi:VIT1/CCC1 family predicted Fe2+/Mn2+ transporter